MYLLLRRIHLIYFMIWICVFFAILYPFYFLFSKSPKGYFAFNICRKINSYGPTLLSGIFFRFKFEQAIDPSKTYIFCANHVSNLDIMYLSMLGKGRFHFMGKQELLQHPLLSIFFKSIDVPVDRSNRMSAFRAFMRASNNLQKGMDLVIFPEGKIDDQYPPKLQEFKSGPIKLAIQLKIAIIPISSTNLWKILWDDGFKYGSRPGIADIYVHAPIEPEVFEGWDEEQLKKLVYQKINSQLAYEH